MGCAGSKLDDLEAVALCRERSTLLAEAIGCGYALADAHAVYSRSLNSVGESLHRFLEGIQNIPAPPSPRLPLPAQRKGEHLGPIPAISGGGDDTGHGHLHSNLGSHLGFHSDSDDLESDDDEDGFPLHSDEDSPIHHHLHDESSPPGPTINYAKNQPPNPSVSYEQRLMSPEAVYFAGGEASSSSNPSSSYYGYPYPPQNPKFYPPYPYGYLSNYGGFSEMGGYFGASLSPAGMPPAGMGVGPSSPASKAAPPPPSPPTVSTWDFLTPFENYESYFAPYAPSRSSRDVRVEAGIPDLEYEENVIVKEAYGNDKTISSVDSSPYSCKGDKISEVGKEPPQLEKRSVDAGLSEENVASVVD